MNTEIDANASVTPYVLCSLCQQVAATYSPDQACVLREGPLDVTDLIRPESLTDMELYWASREPLKHHTRIDDLRQAAAKGCHLCSLWVRALDRHDQKSSFSALGQLFVGPDRNNNDRIYPDRLEVQRSGRSPILQDFWLVLSQELSLPEPARQPLAWMRIGRVSSYARPSETRSDNLNPPVSDQVDLSLISAVSRYKWYQNTGAPVSYHMIAHWMQNCVNTHALCSRHILSRFPTRLLDLFDCPEPGICRLVETHGVDRQPYAALSYRWGECSTITLTDENYNALLAGLRIEFLPKTIQEAVVICKSLSIRYLWVDALRVEQKNRNDFTQEITRMGSIYAGSLVTIAAADSADCESGCFRERDPLQHENCLFWRSENEVAYFGRKVGCTNDFWGPHNRVESRESKTLNQRGWVFQERMMSPRTLHYGKHDIYWECRCGVFCPDCTLHGHDHLQVSKQARPKEMFTSLHKLSRGFTGDTQQTFVGLWAKILMEYTQTQLTYEDDRLSALAGVAEVVVQELKYKASFGLWQEIFVDELMWHVENLWHPSTLRKDQLKDVPSWSWAATRCAVRRYGELVTLPENLIRDIDHEAQLVTLPQATEFDRISAILGQHRTLGSSIVKIQGWITECELLPYEVQVPHNGSVFRHWQLIPCNEKLSEDDEERLESRWDGCLSPSLVLP